MSLPIFILALFAPLITAHFNLLYPPSRGVDKNNQAIFPCGGFPETTKRIPVSLSSPSFPIVLELDHDERALQFLLAIGTDPGTNYNIILHQTFRVEGQGAFCLPDNLISKAILEEANDDGLNMTLQVQTNDYPTGGLYACSDLQLIAGGVPSPSPSLCKNSTGVTAIPFSGLAARRNANESTADGQAQGTDEGLGNESEHGNEGHSESGSETASPSTATDSADSTDAATIQTTWGVLGLLIIGGLAAFLAHSIALLL